MYWRALAGFKKAFGLDHTSSLDTVNNIAILYSWKGQLKEVRRYASERWLASRRPLV